MIKHIDVLCTSNRIATPPLLPCKMKKFETLQSKKLTKEGINQQTRMSRSIQYVYLREIYVIQILVCISGSLEFLGRIGFSRVSCQVGRVS